MKSLLRQLFAAPKPASRKPVTRARLRVEPLERREVPSAAMASVSINNGILNIQGGAGDNDVKVQENVIFTGGHTEVMYNVIQHGQLTDLYVLPAYPFFPGYFNEVDFHGFATGNQSFNNDTALTARAWGGMNASNSFVAGAGHNYFTGGSDTDVYTQNTIGSFMNVTFQYGSHETIYENVVTADSFNATFHHGVWAPASVELWVPVGVTPKVSSSLAPFTTVMHMFEAISVTTTQPPPSNQGSSGNQDSSGGSGTFGSIFVNDGF